ncbi:MAG: TVP38/TMEM64 family protein, partial [Gammaproteobacteria bacterium]|nr:TVP38/TMEM64 family protein [Gammaproteobacteria bacterium]
MNTNRWVRIVLSLVLAAGVMVAFLYRDRLNLEALDAAIKEAGLLGPLVFMSVYALATVLFLPGSVLTLAGGALFGPVAGTFYNLTGATIGATLAFLAARYLASDWVAQKTGGKLK